MLLLYAAVTLQAVPAQTDRLVEIGRYAAISGVCTDLGYTLSNNFSERLYRRVSTEAYAHGFSPAELDQFLAPHLAAFVDESASELDTALAQTTSGGDSEALSSLFARRDKVCHQMTKDPISADLIKAGSPQARETARANLVEAITRSILPGG